MALAQLLHLFIHFFKRNDMTKDTSRSTILIISMGFLILYLIFSWHWAVIISLVVGILGIISGKLSRIIEKVWFSISRLLSYFIPSILLGIVFYLILFPLSILSKIFTKDPLMISNKYRTYFVDIHKGLEDGYFKKMW